MIISYWKIWTALELFLPLCINLNELPTLKRFQCENRFFKQNRHNKSSL